GSGIVTVTVPLAKKLTKSERLAVGRAPPAGTKTSRAAVSTIDPSNREGRTSDTESIVPQAAESRISTTLRRLNRFVGTAALAAALAATAGATASVTVLSTTNGALGEILVSAGGRTPYHHSPRRPRAAPCPRSS